MKSYVIVVRVLVEDDGINGSHPTKKRMESWMLANTTLGKDDNNLVKAKSLEVLTCGEAL